jgi:hypothetical protein
MFFERVFPREEVPCLVHEWSRLVRHRRRASKTQSSKGRSCTETLRNLKRAWVKEQEGEVKDGKVVAYKVNLKVTFVLDGQPA